MLRTLLPRSILTLSSRHLASAPASRTFSQSVIRLAKDPKMPSGPPKHEMVYFPEMNSALPSTSSDFRRVVWTGLYSQVVLMTIPAGGDVGDEAHTVDQVLSFTSGIGKATIAGKDQDVKAGDLMVVPAGTQHQFVNAGPTPLIFYTIYSPAEHNPQTVHKTKEEAEKEEDKGNDEAPDWSRKTMAENEKNGLVNPSGNY